MWLQHALVLAIVMVCVAFVAMQALRTLRGSKGKLGACCAKGCDAQKPSAASERVIFLPAEMLTSSKKRSASS